MKIKIKQSVASRTWSLKKNDEIDTDKFDDISDDQAVRWFNSGIAEPVKETRTTAKKATVKKKTGDKS